MKFQGTIIKNEVREKISKLEAEYNTTFSTTQKLLLCERGPITTILDVLYGEVSLFMLDQHIEKSNEKTSSKSAFFLPSPPDRNCPIKTLSI